MLHLNDLLELFNHMIGGRTANNRELSQNVIKYEIPRSAAPKAYLSDPNTNEMTSIPSDYGSSRSDRAA